MSAIDLSAHNPMRVPNWRWEKARLITAGETPHSRRKDDNWIRRAWRFQTQLEACHTAHEINTLEARFRPVYWAHEIENNAHAEMQLIRFEIQARILARQSLADISHRSGYSMDVLQAYEELFFHVRDRLDRGTFVLHRVIGPAVHRGLSDREPDVLWKLYGYFKGPHMLDSLITTFINPGVADLSQVRNAQGQVVRDNQLRKAMIASHTAPINSFTSVPLQDVWLKQVELERTMENKSEAADAIMKNLEACMNVMPWQLAGGDDSGPRQRRKRIAGAAELRTDELMLSATGQPLPQLAGLKLLAYPEPSTNGQALGESQ